MVTFLNRYTWRLYMVIHILHMNYTYCRPSESKKGPTEAQNDGKSNGQILRHFFDDSATSLSISMPGNPSSDVSLKLSTGDRHSSDTRVNNVERSMWGTNQVSSMGGPLAEALRSSMSNSSPTSVLHHLPRGSTSEACYISTWLDKCSVFFYDKGVFGLLGCVFFL